MKHVNRPRALDLTHYRTSRCTYFDTEWMASDLMELGWEAAYTWMRLLSGPEYTRDGFPAAAVDEAFGPHPEFDHRAAIESLLRAQHIAEEDGHYVFPNVTWGTPPEWDEEDK